MEYMEYMEYIGYMEHMEYMVYMVYMGYMVFKNQSYFCRGLYALYPIECQSPTQRLEFTL